VGRETLQRLVAALKAYGLSSIPNAPGEEQYCDLCIAGSHSKLHHGSKATPMPYLPVHAKRELDFPGTITRGSSGIKARRVQEWLTFHRCATGIDGSFGPATAAAVRAFQSQVGLPETGKVEQKTWGLLVDPLRQALSTTVSPSETLDTAVLRIAETHLLQHPLELGGDNRGPWVRVYVGGNEGTQWRWCAGFVTFVLKQACAALNRSMPIPGSYSCDSLAYQARQNGLFVAGRSVEDGTSAGELGQCQIFLVRQSATDWNHTGLAFNRTEEIFSTIEGNTNDEGSANGYEVCRRTRSMAKKDFIVIPP
jgi:peptidoglycan hydrolase-like protein with peptidoglycan-binding domain